MKRYLLTIITTVAITALTTWLLAAQFMDKAENESSDTEAEPLYWVAPMDPEYRRDEPGKSPMGMDLVPVFAEQGDSGQSESGTVRISPAVVNNLGVRTAQAQRRPLETQINTVGYVQYDEDQLIHVHPRVEGWVETLYVKAEGDPVEKGQPLYQLYSPQLVNAQEELLLALGRDNPRLVEAAEDRLRALQIDSSLIDELKRSRKIEQNLTFYAPMSGVVDNLAIREGFYVQPGTKLLSIGRLDDVWVVAEVFERQAALVQPGLPVTMTLDYLPGQQWQGEVDYIYPSLDAATRTLRVRLRFENPDSLLRPNMYAQVAIQTAGDADQLTVPLEAVIRTGSQDRVVLALGEGRFKSVAVSLGRVTRQYAVIRDGLNEGERVVTSAQFLIDSESSKTSDFMRKSADEMDGRNPMDHSGHGKSHLMGETDHD